MVWLRYLITLILLTGAHCELFTSTTALHGLMGQGQGQKTVVERLIRRRTEGSRGVLQLLSQVHTLYQEQPECIEHPITALKILKNFRAISSYGDEEFHRDLIQNDIPWPTDHDVTGAYHAIARLQKTYDLPVDDVIKGHVAGIQSAFRLEEKDIIGIADEAINMGYNATAARWLNRNWLDLEHIQASGELLCRIASPLCACFSKIHHQTGSDAKCTSSRYDATNLNDKYTRYPEYESLCRESLTTNNAPQSKLFCSYRTGNNPFVRYRQEFYSLDPVIVRFYDVMTNIEGLLTKHVASQILENSVVAVPGKRRDISNFNNRVGQLAWLYDNWHPIIAGISARVGDVTGLSTVALTERTHAEPLQVCNYGIGGHFRPHQDAFAKNVTNIPEIAIGSGNRDATFMFYLTDVTAGGATVFPELGVYVKPIKNTAVLWFNLKRSGERDVRMAHAGCPVLVGNKWIANKWLWSIGQTFIRRCGITAHDNDLDWALQIK